MWEELSRGMMAQSAVSSVLGSVGNLAVRETTFLCGVTSEVRFLKDELVRLQAYLKDADIKQRSGNASVAVLVNQIRAAAYEAQNIIEAADYMEKRNMLKKGFMGAISRYARLPSDLATLRKIGVDIQRVRRMLYEIFQSADCLKIDLDNSVLVEKEFTQDIGQMQQTFEDDVVMVGFEDAHEEIVDKLVDNEKMLSAVSIVAMGGAGKTTLARKIYTSYRAEEQFKILAWVTVSQTFKGIDLLKDILKQIKENTDDSVDQMQEYDVGKKIREILLKKRYLIVLDDVWEDDTWDQLNRKVKAFPDAANGSRVLLTTRKVDVANHVERPTHVHALKHLDEEKSWELFYSKALPPYRRSVMRDLEDFEKLGRKLASKCEGLPLALAVLGSYLSKNMNIQSWSDVLLGWPSTKNVDMMRDILSRSYKDLPNHHLRSCFLYLAAFPEDCLIDVSILIALWISEGFIPISPHHELEETARKYVAELNQRSLVQVTKISRAHGWIDEIRVHDILHDWCIEEAKQDGFLHVIHKTSGQFGEPSTDIMISHSSSYSCFSDQHLKATPLLRALIGFKFRSIYLHEVRLLRVLHIEDSMLKDVSSAIEGCIHLRCLSLIRCKGVTLPSSIGELLYLRTIDMTDTRSLVPIYLWDIPSLRHVSLCDEISPPKVVKQKELRTFRLNLRSCTSSTKCINLGMVKFLSQMTQLTTLTLQQPEDMTPEVMNIVVKMPHLVDVYLNRLSVLCKLPNSHQFPQSLRSFDLCAIEIREDLIAVLEKLQCLVVLKLEGYSGQTMSCSAQGFPCLQNLELSAFHNVEEWKIEAGSMPKLSLLFLQGFLKIDYLPEGLLLIPSLNRLHLQDMPYISIGGDNTLNELQRKGCKVTLPSFLAIGAQGTLPRWQW